MKGYWELRVSDTFAAAHALRHYEGKCERLHGHNFAVEICVIGSELDPRTEILIDFKILKSILKEALRDFDHACLNDTENFARLNPSSENIGRLLWGKINKLLETCADPQAQKVRLEYVRVSEKEGQSATWRCSAGRQGN